SAPERRKGREAPAADPLVWSRSLRPPRGLRPRRVAAGCPGPGRVQLCRGAPAPGAGAGRDGRISREYLGLLARLRFADRDAAALRARRVRTRVRVRGSLEARHSPPG